MGIIEATKKVNVSVPVVVRLKGTNAEEGKKILNESGMNIVGVEGLRDAADKIVSLIKK